MSAMIERSGGLDVDTLLNVINSDRRRRLIELAAERERITLREASEIIAAERKGVDREDITFEDRRSIYAPLYQHHVPQLAENGIIEAEDNVLQATDVTHDVAELIEVLGDVKIGGARA